MADLQELLTDDYINTDVDDLITTDRYYRYSTTNLGADFDNYSEFAKWYDTFCYEWYKVCKSLAKVLNV